MMGLTSVTSQQRAKPWGHAPYTTRAPRTVSHGAGPPAVVDPRFTDVGRDATVLFDTGCDDVQGRLGSRRAGDDVQVVKVSGQFLPWPQLSRCALQQCRGKCISLFAAFRLADVTAGTGIIPPAVHRWLPVKQAHKRQ